MRIGVPITAPEYQHGMHQHCFGGSSLVDRGMTATLLCTVKPLLEDRELLTGTLVAYLIV